MQFNWVVATLVNNEHTPFVNTVKHCCSRDINNNNNYNYNNYNNTQVKWYFHSFWIILLLLFYLQRASTRPTCTKVFWTRFVYHCLFVTSHMTGSHNNWVISLCHVIMMVDNANVTMCQPIKEHQSLWVRSADGICANIRLLAYTQRIIKLFSVTQSILSIVRQHFIPCIKLTTIKLLLCLINLTNKTKHLRLTLLEDCTTRPTRPRKHPRTIPASD